jgi:DNA-binding NarL/FixJ family response regulator
MRKRPTSNRDKPGSDALEEKKHFHGKRVVIVDDHPLIRRGLERMISSGDGFVVCGEAGNAEEGLAVVRERRPDVVIVDIGLPGRDGIELTRELTREFPALAILVLSMHEESHYAERAIEAGAYGYMVKHDAVEKIGTALARVLKREFYLSPSLTSPVGWKTRQAMKQRRGKSSKSDQEGKKVPSRGSKGTFIVSLLNRVENATS